MLACDSFFVCTATAEQLRSSGRMNARIRILRDSPPDKSSWMGSLDLSLRLGSQSPRSYAPEQPRRRTVLSSKSVGFLLSSFVKTRKFSISIADHGSTQ